MRAALLVAAFVTVGAVGLRFPASDTRRCYEEHNELQCRFFDAMDSAEHANPAAGLRRTVANAADAGASLTAPSEGGILPWKLLPR